MDETRAHRRLALELATKVAEDPLCIHVDVLAHERRPVTASTALAGGRPLVEPVTHERELEILNFTNRGIHRDPSSPIQGGLLRGSVFRRALTP